MHVKSRKRFTVPDPAASLQQEALAADTCRDAPAPTMSAAFASALRPALPPQYPGGPDASGPRAKAKQTETGGAKTKNAVSRLSPAMPRKGHR